MHSTTTDLSSRPDARGVRIIATIAAHIYAGFGVFQTALALGAPLGAAAWGGSNDGGLPPALRIASAGAAVLLTWMLFVVLARAGVVRIDPVKRAHLAGFTWAVAGLVALSTLGNLASQNLVEQRVMAPVTALLTALTVVVAHRGVRGGR